jgi:hypothetical protein
MAIGEPISLPASLSAPAITIEEAWPCEKPDRAATKDAATQVGIFA